MDAPPSGYLLPSDEEIRCRSGILPPCGNNSTRKPQCVILYRKLPGRTEKIRRCTTILLAYVTEAGYDPVGIVIEKNMEIIHREDFDKVNIDDGDVIEILHFVGGGQF